MSTYKLHFDGGKRNNFITYGIVIYKNDKIIHSSGGLIETKISSNAAEYVALALGMHTGYIMGIDNLEIYGDSLLVINQMKGKFKVKNKVLKFLNNISHELGKNFKSVTYNWVPRTENKDADRAGRIT